MSVPICNIELLQIYLKNSSRAYYDKYWGRTLKDNEAVKFLGMFFN